MKFEEIKIYDPYTDKFIKNTTTDIIEVGADGSLHNLSISNSYGLYARNQEELDKCDYIDKSTKLYTKDEVISMFAELQSDVKECVDGTEGSPQFEQGVTNARIQVVEMIQEKINSLDNGDVPQCNTAVWIKRRNTPRGYGEYLCSACMNEDGTDFLTTYCPDCGAYHGKNKRTVEE